MTVRYPGLERRIKEWENIGGTYISPKKKQNMKLEYRRPGSVNPRKRAGKPKKDDN